MSNLNPKSKILNPKGGQAVLLAVTLFMLIGLVIAVGVTAPVTRETRIVRELDKSKTGFITAEAGEEDVAYRIKRAMNYDDTEVMELNGAFATSTVSDNAETGAKEILTEGETERAVRKKFMELIKGDRVEFNYGVQAGNGGFVLKNTSSVTGNVYSNGAVDGFNENEIRGTVASAESDGLIDDVYATSSARAHTIQNSTVDGDAYYQSLINTTVNGVLHPNSEDPPPQDFPISDEELDEWQEAAEAGGVINSPCPYKIKTDTTIGPVKINCDLEITNRPTVTLAGMVWVKGNIEIKNAAKIKLDPDLGKKSVAMIANDPADQTTKGIITLRNSITFEGNGAGTYIAMVSRNRDVEDGGSTFGIDFQQTAEGDALLYCNHCGILITNNSELEQVTGWKIELRNSAELIYEQGLANSIFDTGPGGSWDIIEWRESE